MATASMGMSTSSSVSSIFLKVSIILFVYCTALLLKESLAIIASNSYPLIFNLVILNEYCILLHMYKRFLPTSIEEGKTYYNEFSQFDVVFVTGDPYYDDPLSGMSI